MLSLLQMSHTTGPIPSPDLLRAYSEVIPGLDKTIVDEWTIEGASRRANEAKELEIRAFAVKKHACREQWKVTVVGVFMIGIVLLAAYLAYLGQGAHAAAVIATPIAGGAVVKLLSKK